MNPHANPADHEARATQFALTRAARQRRSIPRENGPGSMKAYIRHRRGRRLPRAWVGDSRVRRDGDDGAKFI